MRRTQVRQGRLSVHLDLGETITVVLEVVLVLHHLFQALHRLLVFLRQVLQCKNGGVSVRPACFRLELREHYRGRRGRWPYLPRLLESLYRVQVEAGQHFHQCVEVVQFGAFLPIEGGAG